MLDVSIIIVNYNTKKLLADCIDSIISNTKKVNYEIIVVDNASSDGSVQYINGKNKDQIILIENKKNYGFGKANNIGSKKARGKYLLLLNSDTVLLNDAVSNFYEVAEDNDQDYIYGCYLQDIDGNYINSFSKFQDKKHLLIRSLYLYCPWLLGLRKRWSEQRIEPIEKQVDFITGADLFIRKEDFYRLQGFDEHFFMYCEDEDLCLRAKKIGINCKVVATPKIVHLEGKSSKVSSVKRKMILNSYKYFTKKNLS